MVLFLSCIDLADDCRRKWDRWTVRRDVIGIASSGIGRTLSYVVSGTSGKTPVLLQARFDWLAPRMMVFLLSCIDLWYVLP